MAKSSKHHYVPQFYLKKFGIKGTDHVFAYGRGAEAIRTSIKNIAAENNLYTFVDKDSGQTTNKVEEMFADFEGKVSPVFSKIIESKSIGLNPEEKSLISEFIAVLSTRNPAFENRQRQMEAGLLKEILKKEASDPSLFRKSLERTGIKVASEKEFEALRQSVLEIDESFEASMTGGRVHYLQTAMELSNELADILYSAKNWHFLIADGNRHFITSDDPVVLQSPQNVPKIYSGGFMYGTVILPLSPLYCLLLRNEPLGRNTIRLRGSEVAKINSSIARNAERFVFSHISATSIKKIVDATKPREGVRTTSIPWAPYIISQGPSLDPEVLS